jgi:hypothetical protein
VDFRQEGDKVLKAAAKAIYRPRHDNIKLTAGRCFMQGIERRALVFALGTADAMILEDVDDLPTGALGDLKSTVGGRSPSVECVPVRTVQSEDPIHLQEH